MIMIKKEKINNFPLSDEAWEELGSHFDNCFQAVAEFTDNSISSVLANPNGKIKEVMVTLEEKLNTIKADVEDTGTGFLDKDNAFRIGSKEAKQTFLNAHGLGSKHGLAYFDRDNSGWTIATRNENDILNHCFHLIKAPYSFGMESEIREESEWKGEYNTTGTKVTFEIPKDIFYGMSNCMQKKKGNKVKEFMNVAALIYEELGYTYANIIQKEKVNIKIKVIPMNGSAKTYDVKAVLPHYSDIISTGSVKYNLGKGDVIINYEVGLSLAKEDNNNYEFTNKKTNLHYKNTMTTSGVELRINGRLLKDNLFTEIWGLSQHNSYNSFLCRIDVCSENEDALPRTRTTKNDLDTADSRLESLYEWIRKVIAEPLKSLNDATRETDLFVKLAERYRTYNMDPNKIIDLQRKVFLSTGNIKDCVRMDMYTYINGKSNIYEGKRFSTTCKDVYQLRMYWDGFVYDGNTPDNAYLVAEKHPNSVIAMINHVNNMYDSDGHNYNIIPVTWKELGIDTTLIKKNKKA